MAIDAARAKSLFLAASDLAEAAQRAAYLERECGGDAELRARVEALLRANDAAPLPVIDAVTLDSAPAQPETRDYADPSARLGALLAGKYKLVEEIGEGGMGSVFMAQQTEPVKRAVAVKVIKAGMDSKAVLARFEAERQALAMMDHPNIARVLDAGTTDGGRPFFVMELVKGMPITRYCDEHKLTPSQRLELFVPVCQAIQHAHQKGIIHRDIKPSNVLVALYDDRPVPKVIDFGVAKAAGQTLTDKTLMTGFGAIVGTPEYMSPEQASLNNLDIDTRSDVYSLGVLLYELLTGTTPVDKKSLGEAALLEILRIVREVEPPRPSAKLSSSEMLPSVAANRGTEPARLSRLMKGELDWLVLKALEKDRTRRYETANALSRDIQRYLADEVVEARPPSTAYRLKKFVRRHKGQVIAASLVLFALVAGIAGTTWGLVVARSETAEKEEALGQRNTALGETKDALGKRDLALGEAKNANADFKKANDEQTHQLGVSAMLLANAAHDSRDYKLAAERLDKVPAKQRSWEWRYLNRQVHGGIFTLYGHTGPVTSVAFSPDGNRIVTWGGKEGKPCEAKVWDARTGIFLFDLKGLLPQVSGLNTPIASVAFSPDSKRIVTGGGDNTTRVWDAGTGALQLELTAKPDENVMCAAFSPDDTQIATGHRLGLMKLWDARTGKALHDWQAHSGPVMRVAYSPDGTRILTTGENEGKAWDAKTNMLLLDAKGMMSGYNCAAFSPDGKRIVTGSEDGTARVTDPTTGKLLVELKGRQRQAFGWSLIIRAFGVLSVAYSPDGGRIVTGGTITGGEGGTTGEDFGQASVWDARTGAELLELKGHTGPVTSASFSPDGTRIITGSEDGTARLWDARTGTPRLELDGIKGPIAGASFSPDGTWIVTGGSEAGKPGVVAIWDARTGLPKPPLKGGHVNSLAVSADGARIVTAGGLEAMVWDAQTGAPLVELKGLMVPVRSVAFSPDGTRIVTAAAHFPNGRAIELKVWDARTGTVLLDLTPKEKTASLFGERGGSVAFSPDGRRFVASGRPIKGSPFRMVQILDTETGTALVEMKGNQTPVLSVAFSPDGTRVVTGGGGMTIAAEATIWDAQTGKALVELKGHTGTVNSVAFSPDSNRVVTGSGDRTVRVWDARTGATLAELKGHAEMVTSVSFSADGTRLLSASGGWALKKPGEVIVWDAPIPKPALELMGHTAGINATAFSPDGSRLATSSYDLTVKVWDTRTGAALLDLKGHTDAWRTFLDERHAGVGHLVMGVEHVVFSPDGTRILTCDWKTAKVWDAKTGSALLGLKGQEGAESMARGAFSPDGTRVVTWGITREKGQIKGVATVWDAKGTVLVKLNGLPSSVASVSFSPDGTRLFTRSGDGKALAWDASTGEELPGAAIPPMDLKERISPDGRLLAYVIQNRVKLVSLVPDAEEIAYRRLHTQPNPSRYRAGYLAARAAKDDFAAAFYLNLIPPNEQEPLIARADVDALADLSKLANEYLNAGKPEEAVPLLTEILNVKKAKFGAEDPATIAAVSRLANVYHRMGQFEKAIPLLEDVVKNRKAKKDPQTPIALGMLGRAYRDAGRLNEAMAVLEEAAAKDARMTRDLLDLYERAGEHAKVIDPALKQLAAFRKSNPKNIVQQADLLGRIGRAYLAQKKWSEAEPHLRACVALWAKAPAPDWTTFEAQSLLGGSLLGQKKYADAEPLLLKGYEGMKQRKKSTEPWAAHRLAEALDRLIDLYTATNKLDEAKKWHTERAKYPKLAPREEK